MSFSVSFKPINLDKILKRLDGLGGKADKALMQALGEAAILIHSTAVKSIQSHQSSGIKYGNHTASKPGFAPNTDTGSLVKSIGFEVDASKNQAVVGTNLDYGAWLEFGTRDIAPRPWLLPAFRKNLRAVRALFTNAARAALK